MISEIDRYTGEPKVSLKDEEFDSYAFQELKQSIIPWIGLSDGLADHSYQYCEILFDVSLCFEEDPNRVDELTDINFDFETLGYASPGQDCQRQRIAMMALQELAFGALTALNSGDNTQPDSVSKLHSSFLHLFLKRCAYTFRRYYLDQQLRGPSPLRR